MQFILISGIDMVSGTSNASTGAMEDISNALLILDKKIAVNSVWHYIS